MNASFAFTKEKMDPFKKGGSLIAAHVGKWAIMNMGNVLNPYVLSRF
jgi:hypothetical protein